MWQCLLLSLAVYAGQPETPGPSEEPEQLQGAVYPFPVFPPNPKVEPITALTAPPDRWLLQKVLQGTGPGDLLDASRMQLYGWIEGSFTGSTAPNFNLPMGFNYQANQFLLHPPSPPLQAGDLLLNRTGWSVKGPRHGPREGFAPPSPA